ncbi:MAG: hypothetical protein MH137_11235 [Flavobacteriales bacterium]|nr:hypothetical protein [Flavobacteriales bacterium]
MNKYRIKLKKETTGQILVTYQEGTVKSIIFEPKEPEKIQNAFRYLIERIPFFEKEVQSSGLPLEAVSGKLTADKIALFCRMYKQYCLVDYKISRAETGMIKGAEVTEPLLKVYFETTEWWAKTKSVTNYYKNLNEIRRIAAVGNNPKFPNGWDKSFAAKLTPQQLPEYFRHLREIGLEPKKNPLGHTIDWIPCKTPKDS